MSSVHPRTTQLASPFDRSTDLLGLTVDPGDVVCRPVEGAAERAICSALRHEVFVDEQSIFATSDRDDRDVDPATIHLIADVGGVAGGTVRIYRLNDKGLWKGDRLAVLAPFRQLVVGQRLVRCAVETAGKLGGHEMVATVQVPATSFFERLGWHRDGEPAIEYGRPHQRMRIGLGP